MKGFGTTFEFDDLLGDMKDQVDEVVQQESANTNDSGETNVELYRQVSEQEQANDFQRKVEVKPCEDPSGAILRSW
jgi:hypothetical protein